MTLPDSELIAVPPTAVARVCDQVGLGQNAPCSWER
jgi:hypothetical protein